MSYFYWLVGKRGSYQQTHCAKIMSNHAHRSSVCKLLINSIYPGNVTIFIYHCTLYMTMPHRYNSVFNTDTRDGAAVLRGLVSSE